MNSSFKKYTVLFFALFLCTIVFAQEKYVLNGRVLNSSKEPVSQVSIRIPGGSDPVYTDSNGQFQLDVEGGSSNWLVIRPLEAYSEKYQLLNRQDSIVIFLTALDLDSKFDDIALPVREKKRKDMIAAFSTLDGSKFENEGYTNVQQYIQGKSSGTFISSNSGMPGSGASVYIRGFSSLLTNNQPLYVVDGIPVEDAYIYDETINGFNYDPISAIDPQDISEITILKDAAATAAFGLKGANGVIFIKTLEPKETKTTINVTLKTGLTQKPDYFQQLDGNQFKNLANELLFSSGKNQEQYEMIYPGLFYGSDDFERIIYSHDTNWQDQVYRNAIMQNFRFSIKGGDAIAKYGLSIGYLNSEGVFKNSSMDRFNIRLVGAFDIFSWLHMNINSSLTTNTSLVKESGLSMATSPLMSALIKSPMLNPYVYDSGGELLQTIDEVKEFGVSNPTAISELMNGSIKNYRFLTSMNLVGEITEHIQFKSVFGLNSNNLKEFMFIPDQGFGLFYNDEAYNVSKAQNSAYLGLYNDNQISYSMPDYTKAYKLDASIGIRWQTNKYEEDWGIGKNSASDDYQYLQRGSTVLREMGGRNSNWNWGALYANAAYSYKEKYLATVSMSADISSRLGTEAKGAIKIGSVPLGTFYSIGGAWRISEEGFLKDIYALEELKVRASYGISGNDDVGEVNAISHYNYDHYRLTSVLVPGGLANNTLTYQNKNQTNIGLDISLFANRFSLSADYFTNKSKNILLYSNVYESLGFDYYPSNSASLNTAGFELNLFGRLVDAPDFNIDFGLNFSKYSSIIDEIPGGEYLHKGSGNVELINREGEQINSFYGYKFDGVFSTQVEANEANLRSDKGIPFMAGDARFINTNDDNVIDANDKQLLGSFEPDFFGGISFDVRYRRISLNSLFQGVYGNEVFNYVRYQNEKMTDLSNQSIKVLQRWQYEGQKTNVPKAMWNDPAGNNAFSDRWIEDGSYLRLKNLTLAYDIREKVLAFSSLKIFVTASNLFTLSKYMGYDPEFSYSSDLMHQGMDYGLMPISKQFVIGVKVGL